MLNEENSILNNELNIDAYYYYEEGDEKKYQEFITTAPPSRDWMNENHVKYIYQCQPVVSSNQTGWFILQTHDVEVEWNGGKSPQDIKIFQDNSNQFAATVASHFGSGIISIAFPVLFKTPPGWGLIAGGPSNIFIDGLFPLEGIVETNWSPYPFTMNYKITRPNHKIKIPKYHPICRIVPIPLNLNEKTTLKYQNIKLNKDLNDNFKEWSSIRRKLNEDRKTSNVDLRMGHYRNGMNIKGCPVLGVHKMLYKFKNIIN